MIEYPPPAMLVPMTEQHAKAVAAWTYDPPLDGYSWPGWERLLAEKREFADPAVRAAQYAAALTACGRLCGFVQFFPLQDWVRLGMGLHPDWLGRGFGSALAALAAEEAARRHPGRGIDLEVSARHERAVRAYRKAGFAIEQTYEKRGASGPEPVHCMVINIH